MSAARVRPPDASGRRTEVTVAMNVLLWLLQIALAVVFAMAGLTKLTQPRERLASTMGWVQDFSDNTVKTIGTLELLAAVGLILPAWTGIAPVLTPLAATGLVLLMIGAVVTHSRRHERQMMTLNLVLFVLALIVAWGRFGPYAY
jgi:uncharacterized membrane protein YphA (DoxX/SURF4 family)